MTGQCIPRMQNDDDRNVNDTSRISRGEIMPLPTSLSSHTTYTRCRWQNATTRWMNEWHERTNATGTASGRFQTSTGSPWGHFIFLDFTFSDYSSYRKKDNFAFGERAALSIPDQRYARDSPFSPPDSHRRLIFRVCIYHPRGNDVPLEIGMAVGVYGYRLTMEIKHFRAPREMHTFPLATRENSPSRSLAIPSRHRFSSNTAQLIHGPLPIKATRPGSRYAFVSVLTKVASTRRHI